MCTDDYDLSTVFHQLHEILNCSAFVFQVANPTYSYSPLVVITLTRIRDANWRLSRFETYERKTPIGVYRV